MKRLSVEIAPIHFLTWRHHHNICAIPPSRQKRATIIKAEGDRHVAAALAEAAATMAQSPGAMQLRVLQTVDGLGPSASNTVVLARWRRPCAHTSRRRRARCDGEHDGDG